MMNRTAATALAAAAVALAGAPAEARDRDTIRVRPFACAAVGNWDGQRVEYRRRGERGWRRARVARVPARGGRAFIDQDGIFEYVVEHYDRRYREICAADYRLRVRR